MTEPDHSPGRPPWVRIAAIALFVLLVLILFALVLGGGHLAAGAPATALPPLA